MLAVVLYHLVTKHVETAALDFDARGVASLQLGVSLFTAIRMPLFFAISGMFAASALSRPWGEVWKSKVWFFYYLYVLWLFIQTALLQLTPYFRTKIAGSYGDIVLQLTTEPSTLWYLYALAVYFPLAKLCSRIPKITLVLALLVSLAASSGLAQGQGNMPSVLRYFVWFAVGVYLLKPRSIPHLARWWTCVAALAGYAIVVTYMRSLGGNAVLLAVASVFGILVGLGGAVLLERHARPVASVLAYVGRRTLPIYVLHLPLVAAFDTLMPELPFMSSYAGTVGYTYVCTAVISGIALVIYELTYRTVPILYRPPRLPALRGRRKRGETAVPAGPAKIAGDSGVRTD